MQMVAIVKCQDLAPSFAKIDRHVYKRHAKKLLRFASHTKFDQIIVFGDFNLPKITMHFLYSIAQRAIVYNSYDMGCMHVYADFLPFPVLSTPKLEAGDRSPIIRLIGNNFRIFSQSFQWSSPALRTHTFEGVRRHTPIL